MSGSNNENNLTDAERSDLAMTKWFIGLVVVAALWSAAVILFIL